MIRYWLHRLDARWRRLRGRGPNSFAMEFDRVLRASDPISLRVSTLEQSLQSGDADLGSPYAANPQTIGETS